MLIRVDVAGTHESKPDLIHHHRLTEATEMHQRRLSDLSITHSRQEFSEASFSVSPRFAPCSSTGTSLLSDGISPRNPELFSPNSPRTPTSTNPAFQNVSQKEQACPSSPMKGCSTPSPTRKHWKNTRSSPSMHARQPSMPKFGEWNEKKTVPFERYSPTFLRIRTKKATSRQPLSGSRPFPVSRYVTGGKSETFTSTSKRRSEKGDGVRVRCVGGDACLDSAPLHLTKDGDGEFPSYPPNPSNQPGCSSSSGWQEEISQPPQSYVAQWLSAIGSSPDSGLNGDLQRSLSYKDQNEAEMVPFMKSTSFKQKKGEEGSPLFGYRKGEMSDGCRGGVARHHVPEFGTWNKARDKGKSGDEEGSTAVTDMRQGKRRSGTKEKRNEVPQAGEDVKQHVRKSGRGRRARTSGFSFGWASKRPLRLNPFFKFFITLRQRAFKH